MTNLLQAEDPAEQRRVEQAGGFIQKNRVLGFLAITRSFGDHAMKDFVTCHPHITTTRIDAQPCPFVIIACDGVWDVLTYELLLFCFALLFCGVVI